MTNLTEIMPMNMTIVNEFLLLGFSLPSDIVPVIFFMFLLSCMLSISGNILIISLYLHFPSLQIPMYFFLCNLAILDITFVNIIVPYLLKVVINQTSKMTVTSCLTQSYLYFLVGTTQFYLLDVMCYDRYVAICHPLHYSVAMHKKKCVQLVIGCWFCSFFSILLPSTFILRQTYCFKTINHFFCDVWPLLRNSCSNPSSLQILVTANSVLLIFSLMVAVISYGHILLAVFKINSSEGRKRVLSTCSSHAIVVTIFFGSCMFMYLKPVQYEAVEDYDKKMAVLNTVVVPMINPYIYTLRNKIIKDIIKNGKEKHFTI